MAISKKASTSSLVKKNVSKSLIVCPKTQRVFDRKGYKAETKISEGAFGEVYKGYSTSTGDKVAIKVMDLKKMAQRVQEVFLPREIEALATIRHKFVVEVFDIFQADDKLFIFMEFANQGDIKGWITKHGALEEAVAAYWFNQVCQALDYIHNTLEMVHRDIKVDNVLLHDHKAKLSDFGFARVVKAKDGKIPLSQTYCGTPTYYCPQLIDRRPYNAFCADNFAMGVMLFVMMNNKHPFSSSKMPQVRAQMNDPNHLSTRYIKDFPADYKELQEGFFVVDEENRMTVAQALQSAWLLRLKR